MNPTANPADQRVIALACSALARAGQQLSTVQEAGPARAALRQVADQVESDRNLAQVVDVGELAQRCRAAADITDDRQVVTSSRQIATGVARQASSLATDIQHGRTPIRTRSTPQVPRSVPEPSSPPSPIPSSPAPEPPAVETPEPVSVAPRPPMTAAPAPAVAARFQFLPEGAVLDLRTGRRWVLLPGAVTYSEAVSKASQFSSGGQRDWRLPQPAELDELLRNGGWRDLSTTEALRGSRISRLWTAEVRSRFLGFIKEARISEVSGASTFVSRGTGQVHALLTRGS